MSVHSERYVNSPTLLYPEAESNSSLLESSEQPWSRDSKEEHVAEVTLHDFFSCVIEGGAASTCFSSWGRSRHAAREP